MYQYSPTTLFQISNKSIVSKRVFSKRFADLTNLIVVAVIVKLVTLSKFHEELF